MIDDEITEIRKRLSETTPGDWWQGLYNFDSSNEMVLVGHGEEMQAVAATTRHTYPVANGWDTERSWENAYFIAHSKDYIKILLDEIDRLNAQSSPQSSEGDEE